MKLNIHLEGRIVLLVWVMLSLVACGGGGGGGGDATPKTNLAPISNSGPDQIVYSGDVITLDGTSSSDANNELLAFQWGFTSKPEGSVAVLSNNTAAKPTFTADVAGIYELSLVVSDGKISSVADTVTIKVADKLTSRIVAVSWTGAATGVQISGLDVTIDYNQAKVNFNSALTGSLTSDWQILPNNNGDMVEAGMISAGSFNGGVTSGTVIKFIFDIVSGTPSSSDFVITKITYVDGRYNTIALNPTDVAVSLVNP